MDPTPAPAAAVSRPRPAVTRSFPSFPLRSLSLPSPALIPSVSRVPTKEYWGDGVSTITAPGGGILRIGYDQARFEQAVKEVIMEPEDLSPLGGGAGVGLAIEEAKVDGEMRKEDVGVLVSVPPLRWGEEGRADGVSFGGC